MRSRLVVTFALTCGTIALARANGAMGLALEMFNYAYWWPYVAVTVVLEAWLIGRKLCDGWPKAVGISILANAITAGCCPMICVVGLHGSFVGSTLNPDPFLNGVVLFSSFGLVSALLESVIWKLRRNEPSDWAILKRSLIAHAVGVPVALLILLIPGRPYQGLEVTAGAHRTRILYPALKKFAESAVGEPQGLPKVASATDFVNRFVIEQDAESTPDAWTAAYLPDFHRFDFGEEKRIPFQWNTHATGLLVGPDFDWNSHARAIWLIRAKREASYQGYALDPSTGEVAPFHGMSASQLDADAANVLAEGARLKERLQQHETR